MSAVLNPMPLKNKTRIHDHLLGLRLTPGRKYTLEEMAKAIECWWPGVSANQVRATLAGLASREKWLRGQTYFADRTPRRESG